MKKRKLTKEGSKQVPWDDLNKEYASHKEIRDDIRKHPDKYSNIKNKAYSDLRKLCENSAVRYMRSGQKCKIHYWDFIACVGKKKEIDPSELPKELIKRGWKKIWSLKPFDEGEFCKYYAPGKLPKFGAIRKPSDKKIKFVEETIQAPLKVPNVRTFLQAKCNIQNLSGWGWDEMMPALVRYRQSPKKDKLNLITIAVAVKNFHVSTATIKRRIKAGTLKSHRPDNSPKNSPHRVDAKEIAADYTKK